MNLESVDKHLKEKLKDPYFRELYELDEQKLQIVKRIIEYRIEQGMNQKQLADQIGVSQQHISKIENGEFSSVMTLEKVLLFIGYTVKLQAIRLDSKISAKISKIIRSKRFRLAV